MNAYGQLQSMAPHPINSSKIAIHGPEPYKFIRKNAIRGPKPYEVIWEIAIHGPKPCELIIWEIISHGPKTYENSHPWSQNL